MAESLAVKYRPQSFDDVVGQENVITILENQLEKNAVKNGYTFTGGAGTGKTTIARIFAKRINQGGKVGEIIEIDAASNNGVDNVREIRETCKFKPINGGFKVYIIDEVHMLSTGAFNALLKTLEEPPAHAVFILCTTDPHKIPATILSRVQRFDFTRMTIDQTVGRLQYILEKESGYQVSDAALEYISKLANGGMRAAISLLDTCVSYKSELDLQDIFDIIGVPDYQEFLAILKAMAEGRHADIIEIVENLHVRGKDLKRFVLGLLEFIIDLRKVDLMPEKYAHFVSAPSVYYQDMENMVQMLNSTGFALAPLFRKVNDLSNRVKFEGQPKLLIQGELIA